MNNMLVFQTDFGLVDGAVSAMYGVALSVDPSLRIFDLTHEIPPFDTFEASYRLIQSVPYWPKETTFVTVVDPGVGTKRKSIVAKTKNEHYIVSPNNGSLSHILKTIGLEEVREISEEVGRRDSSSKSNTFHGRDIYAYTGALIASNKIAFEDIGDILPIEEVVVLEDMYPEIKENEIQGTIETLDVRFGSLWTNISSSDFEKLNVDIGEDVNVEIWNGNMMVYHSAIKYASTFNEVNIGDPLLYTNSMDSMGLAINQGNFAKAYNIGTRFPWKIILKKNIK